MNDTDNLNRDYALHAELALVANAVSDADFDAAALAQVGMSVAQAATFLETWQMVARFVDDDVGVGAVLFKRIPYGEHCLAVRWYDTGADADFGRMYNSLRERVVEWLEGGVIASGTTVCGHSIGGFLAVALMREFPKCFAFAFTFQGNKSSMVSGVPTGNGLATTTYASALDLPLLTHCKQTGRLPDLSHELRENDMRRLAALLILLELLTGCKTLTQMQMDAEVDRLCSVDGGLKIYETVSLPPEKFKKNGDINFYVGSGGENWLGPDYIWKSTDTYLQPGGDPNATPHLRRNHAQIFRRSDGKLLGESIRYTRFGGDPDFVMKRLDFPGSHYSCPKEPIKTIGNVFIKQTNTGGAK